MKDAGEDEWSDEAPASPPSGRKQQREWGPIAAALALVAVGGARVGRRLFTHADDLGRAVSKSADEVGAMAGRQADEVGGIVRQADDSGSPRFGLGGFDGLAGDIATEGVEQVGSMAVEDWLYEDDEEPAAGGEAAGARPLDASIEQLEQTEVYAQRTIELPAGVQEYELVKRASVARFQRRSSTGTGFDETVTETELPSTESGAFLRLRLSKWGDSEVRCVRQLRVRLPGGPLTVAECVGDLAFVGDHVWSDIVKGEETVTLAFTGAGAASFAQGLTALCVTNASAELGGGASIGAAFETQPVYGVTVSPAGVELTLQRPWKLKFSGTY